MGLRRCYLIVAVCIQGTRKIVIRKPGLCIELRGPSQLSSNNLELGYPRLPPLERTPIVDDSR